MTRLLCLAFLFRAAAAQGATFNVLAYGGVADGQTVNTAAFASAVAAAHASWAATGRPASVLAPASGSSVYLSGQIRLLSGVTLLVAPGVRLLASANVSDYPPSAWAFLYAQGATDIAVAGGGIVDGNFEAFIAGYDVGFVQLQPRGWPNCSGECRPRLAQFIDSVRIEVSRVSFVGSPDWTFHLLNCTYVHVHDWTQRGDARWPNNDGIDIDSSSHVLLEDSDIDTADDGICIKGSTPGGASVNVTARRCRVRSRSSAVKYGSNCPIPMSGHLFEDLEVHDSNRALALQARDGGLLRDITFRRINITGARFWPWKWWGDGGPIYISTMLRDANSSSCDVRDVVFEDIASVSQNGALLSGLAPGHTLRNITLRRVNLTIDRLPEWNYSTGVGVEKEDAFGPRLEYDPTLGVIAQGSVNTSGWMAGLFVEGVEGLQLEDVNIAFNNERWQPYWGTACLNLTAAGHPVSQVGGSCVPPAAPPAPGSR